MPALVAMNKLWGIFLLLAAWNEGFAQPVPANVPEPAIKVDVDVVNVLCTVYDKRGALVQDLAKDDFEVLENGRRQEIRYFARDTDLPLTVALLVDVSGSVRALIRDEKDAAAKFLQAVIRASDQALLVGFSSSIVLWQDFTPSVERLSNALSRMHAVPFHGLPPQGLPMPGTLLYDTVLVTARDKLGGVSGRKVMVIISDGLDNGSLNHSQDAIAAVQSANAVVYGICYQSGFSGCDFLKDWPCPPVAACFRPERRRRSPTSSTPSRTSCAANTRWAMHPRIGRTTAPSGNCRSGRASAGCACKREKAITPGETRKAGRIRNPPRIAIRSKSSRPAG